MKQQAFDKPSSRLTNLRREQEFDYMLSEIDHERRLMDERRRRVEQVVSFYLTILSAIIAATVAAAVATTETTFMVILILASLAATAVGHLTFLAIIALLAEIVASHSHFYVRRQYFLDMFPKIQKYVEHRANADIRETSRMIFNRSTKLFLRLFATFNCILLGAFVWASLSVTILWAQSNGLVSKFEITFPIFIASFIVLCIALGYEFFLISKRIRRAKEWSYRIFKNFPVTTMDSPEEKTAA